MKELYYKGHTIEVVNDDNASSPRKEWDNFGTMICFHRRYRLGDKHSYDNPHSFLTDIAGDKASEDDTPADLLKKIEEGGTAILPVYLYDHSGLRMSTTSFNDRWDSGQVGFIYASKESIEKEGFTIENAKKYLEGEVETYDRYLSGEVYGYRVIGPDGEETDACWGFFDDPENVLKEAQSVVDADIKRLEDKRIARLKILIRHRVPLYLRDKILSEI